MEKSSHSLQTKGYKPNGEPEKCTEHAGGAVDDWNDALGYFIVYKFGIVRASIGAVRMRMA